MESEGKNQHSVAAGLCSGELRGRMLRLGLGLGEYDLKSEAVKRMPNSPFAETLDGRNGASPGS